MPNSYIVEILWNPSSHLDNITQEFIQKINVEMLWKFKSRVRI